MTRQAERQGTGSGTTRVHHRGNQEVGSVRLGERGTPSDVVGQSSGGAQGEWEVEDVY